jgi:hypothetical protein
MEVRPTQILRRIPWTGCLVVLGFSLRLYHYLRNPSMWHDEAALVLNVLGKNFTELLGPLFFSEAAPPLFLWIEKAATILGGDGTYALRLVPLIASCGSLLLLTALARRVLHPEAVPWAVLLFACSDHLLWHACEAKPYAVDVLVATALPLLYYLTGAWPFRRQVVLFGLLAPVVIWSVYPGCFLYGGLLVALFPRVWHCPEKRLSYGLLILAVMVPFILLLAGPIHAQRCTAMTQCWEGSFPPWDKPWRVSLWVVVSSLEVCRYCCEPIGQILALPAAFGAYSLWRRRRRALLTMVLVPILLALLASCIGAYPFAGARVLVYATPALVLLSAEGAAALLAWLTARSAARGPGLAWAGLVVLVVCLLASPGHAVVRIVIPWPRADCDLAATYVLDHRRPDEPVAGNHWEYAYYFRHLSSAFTLLEGAPHPFGDRLWVVATSGELADRLEIVEHLPPGDWQTLERHDFRRASAFRLIRRPARDPSR